jgi:biotin-(acetyl-CoA carboxylase) ligase
VLVAVLVDERKISGTLIESSSRGYFFLIGIGINLAYSPTIPTTGPNHGRRATSFHDHCNLNSNIERIKVEWENLAREWAVELAYNLHTWLTENSLSLSSPHEIDIARAIVEGWKEWLDWDMELVMRDTKNHERVKLVNVLPDGRVEVDVVDEGRTSNNEVTAATSSTTGKRRTLVSDYFL